MELLRDIPAEGYPTDYLVARVRARRAELLSRWRTVPGAPPAEPTSDESLWNELLAEFDWLRRQMNPRLRQHLAPVFTLFSVKTLVLCLRNKAARRHVAVERLLRHDLFADDLRDALVGAPDVGQAVAAVATAFGTVLGDERGLAAAYATGGLKEFEARLTRDYLVQVASARLHPAVHRFFVTFIDQRNLMTLYKQLRWGFQDSAAFVAGGTVATARLADAAVRGDTRCLDACVREIAGDAAPAMGGAEVALESRLLSALTLALRKAGRQGDEVEVVLDYLWEIYVHARNSALRLHAGHVDAATLERELIA
jgi:vacuolar-type H+-ATPase subunit C/Vma6